MSGLACQCTRQTADHQHQAGGIQFAGFIDGAAVVGMRGLQPGGIGSGEHAAAAIARELQSMFFDEGRDFVEAHGCNLVTPWRDGRDAACHAGFDDLVQRQIITLVFANRGGVNGQPLVVF